jgi:hypothetical protein
MFSSAINPHTIKACALCKLQKKQISKFSRPSLYTDGNIYGVSARQVSLLRSNTPWASELMVYEIWTWTLVTAPRSIHPIPENHTSLYLLDKRLVGKRSGRDGDKSVAVPNIKLRSWRQTLSQSHHGHRTLICLVSHTGQSTAVTTACGSHCLTIQNYYILNKGSINVFHIRDTLRIR